MTPIVFQLSLFIFGLYPILSDQPKWFWSALLWHTFVNALAIYFVPGIHNSLWGVVGLKFVRTALAAAPMQYSIGLGNKTKGETAIEQTFYI